MITPSLFFNAPVPSMEFQLGTMLIVPDGVALVCGSATEVAVLELVSRQGEFQAFTLYNPNAYDLAVPIRDALVMPRHLNVTDVHVEPSLAATLLLADDGQLYVRANWPSDQHRPALVNVITGEWAKNARIVGGYSRWEVLSRAREGVSMVVAHIDAKGGARIPGLKADD